MSAKKYPPVVVVDRQDNVVGDVPLMEAREKGLIYRVVFVVAQNAKGEFLLQRRASNMHLYPDCWDVTAGGHVDDGHSYEEAIRLELAEEVGIRDAHMEEIAHFYTDTPLWGGIGAHRFVKIFRIELENIPAELGTDEVSEVRWFSRHDIEQLVHTRPEKVAEGLMHVWERILR